VYISGRWLYARPFWCCVGMEFTVSNSLNEPLGAQKAD
jgi:hypothetical protein